MSVAQKSESIIGKEAKIIPPHKKPSGSAPIWCPKLHIIEKARLDPTGDIPPEHRGAKLFRKGILLFVLE